MHRYQRLVHSSKQFWNWFCVMTFRAAVVLLLTSSVSSKWLPFSISFIFGNRKQSLVARSDEQAGCSNTVICLVAKHSLTDSVVWAGRLGPFLPTPSSCQDLQLRFSQLFLCRCSLALLCTWRSAKDLKHNFTNFLQCFLQFCLLLAVLISLRQWHFLFPHKTFRPL